MTAQTVSDAEILQYMPLVKSVATRLWKSCTFYHDLEDLISEGVIGLLRAFDKFDPEKGYAFKTFAGIKIRGAILDKIRELSPASRTHQAEIEAGEAAPIVLNSWEEVSHCITEDLYKIDDTRLDKEQWSDILQELISSLSKRQRECILAYYFQDFSMRDAGDLLGLAEGTVCSHIHRGLAGLRRKLMKGTCPECKRPDQLLIKGLCRTRCYPKSYRLAKAKESWDEATKRSSSAPPKQEASTKVLSLDFTEYPQIFEKLVKEAKSEVRDPEKQVLWILIKHFAEFGD